MSRPQSSKSTSRSRSNWRPWLRTASSGPSRSAWTTSELASTSPVGTVAPLSHLLTPVSRSLPKPLKLLRQVMRLLQELLPRARPVRLPQEARSSRRRQLRLKLPLLTLMRLQPKPVLLTLLLKSRPPRKRSLRMRLLTSLSLRSLARKPPMERPLVKRLSLRARSSLRQSKKQKAPRVSK